MLRETEISQAEHICRVSQKTKTSLKKHSSAYKSGKSTNYILLDKKIIKILTPHLKVKASWKLGELV